MAAADREDYAWWRHRRGAVAVFEVRREQPVSSRFFHGAHHPARIFNFGGSCAVSRRARGGREVNIGLSHFSQTLFGATC